MPHYTHAAANGVMDRLSHATIHTPPHPLRAAAHTHTHLASPPFPYQGASVTLSKELQAGAKGKIEVGARNTFGLRGSSAKAVPIGHHAEGSSPRELLERSSTQAHNRSST